MKDFLLKNAKQHNYTFGVVNIPACEKYVQDKNGSLASLLSPQELLYVARAQTLKRKSEFIAGRLAAKKAAQFMFDYEPENYHLLNITKKEDGAPVIDSHPECVVTISHSHDYAIALLAKRPIGLDVEKIEYRPPALVTYFCHPEEKKIYHQFKNNLERQNELLTTWWTRKEAISKYTQLGGRMLFSSMNTNEDNFVTGKPPQHIQLISEIDNGYAVTIAV